MKRMSREKADGPVAESGTVTVACKLPNGLILQLCKMEEFDEPLMGGGFRRGKKAVRIGEPITVNGCRFPFGTQPDYRIVAGYALTENVPAEFWKEWLEQNGDSPVVKNKIIFAYEKIDRVIGVCKENASRLTGLEPINPVGDPRMPKDIRLADRDQKAA